MAEDRGEEDEKARRPDEQAALAGLDAETREAFERSWRRYKDAFRELAQR